MTKSQLNHFRVKYVELLTALAFRHSDDALLDRAERFIDVCERSDRLPPPAELDAYVAALRAPAGDRTDWTNTGSPICPRCGYPDTPEVPPHE